MQQALKLAINQPVSKTDGCCYPGSVHCIYQYQIVSVRQVQADLWVVRLLPLAHHLPFKAGHYCMLWCPDGQFRPYSIASAPDASGAIELHMRLRSKHQALKSMLQAGRRIQLTGPHGRCAFDYQDRRPVIFLAEGTGIAAFLSVLSQPIMVAKQLVWVNLPEDQCYVEVQMRHPEVAKARHFRPAAFEDALPACREQLGESCVRLYFAGSPVTYQKVRQYFANDIMAGRLLCFSDV